MDRYHHILAAVASLSAQLARLEQRIDAHEENSASRHRYVVEILDKTQEEQDALTRQVSDLISCNQIRLKSTRDIKDCA